MAVADVPVELAGYLEELVARLSEAVELEALYLFGSAAQGAYAHGRSDVDVIGVTARPLLQEEKESVAKVAESIPCPARKLELVMYACGAERHELNVNTGELVHFDPDDDPSFWFVLDRSIAEQHSIPLLGPPWEELFAPVSHQAVVEALEQASGFEAWDDPAGAELAAVRAQVWRDTGRWISKSEARGRL
jgi:predicted nucleotidyltransferase